MAELDRIVELGGKNNCELATGAWSPRKMLSCELIMSTESEIWANGDLSQIGGETGFFLKKGGEFLEKNTFSRENIFFRKKSGKKYF